MKRGRRWPPRAGEPGTCWPIVVALALAAGGAGCASPGEAEQLAPRALTIGEVGVDNGGDFPDGAQVVSRGRAQLETTSYFTSTSEPQVRSTSLPILLRLGVAEAVELRLGGTAFDHVEAPDDDASGAGPISVGAKLRLLNDDGEPSWRLAALAFQLDVQLPVGSSDFAGEKAQPLAALNFAFDLTGPWVAALNLEAGAPVGSDGDSFLQGGLEWTLGYVITPTLGAYITGSLSHPYDAGQSGAVNLLGGGVGWTLGSSCAIYCLYSVGTTDESPDVLANLGIAFAF